MEANSPCTDYFLSLPLDILVDLLRTTDRSTIVNFASACKNHKNQFNQEDGLWKRLTLKIFGWTALDASRYFEGRINIDWRKEYRVAVFYDHKIRNNSLVSKGGINPYNFVTPTSVFELYPLPIGDFSTAYYEFKMLGNDKFGVLCYGAALHGFDNALPGMGRNSFGYCSDGMIHLECETAPEDVPTFGNGDILGFGINFAKKSIFFTKNGKMIQENTTNAHGHKLKNIKTLFATISKMKIKALSVNFGAKPFVFDLIQYQQQNPKAEKFKLFSELIRDHLTTLSESETFLDPTTFEQPYLTLEFYPPRFDRFKLNPFLYTLTFLKLPPGYNSAITDEVFDLFLSVHGIMDARKMLPSMQNSDRIQGGIKDITRSLGIKSKGKSWNQLVKDVHTECFKFYCMVAYQLALEMRDAIIKHAFEEEEQWAFKLVRLLTLGDEKINSFCYVVDAAIEAGDQIPGLENPTYAEVFSIINCSIPMMRIDGIRQIINQKLEYVMVPMKIKDLEKAMKIFGDEDPALVKFYREMKTYPHKVRRIEKFMPFVMKSLLSRTVTTMPILYGIHVMKILPNKFNTKQRFVAEMHKRLDKLLTDKAKVEYLKHTLAELKSVVDEDLPEYSLPLIVLFGLEYKKNQESMPKYRRKIERLLKKKLGITVTDDDENEEVAPNNNANSTNNNKNLAANNNITSIKEEPQIDVKEINDDTNNNNHTKNEETTTSSAPIISSTSMEDVD
jgi:hypothetical protein